MEPITELNKHGFNPALERRVLLKLQDPDGYQYNNIYYMQETPENDKIYRTDINKIETKGKLCIKEHEELRKEDEFNHVETSYRRLRQIMLYKKFEVIMTERAA
jgi:hypothetical protein